jgi:hypothetical protein
MESEVLQSIEDKLQHPLVAWSYQVPRHFMYVFLIKALQMHPGMGFADVPEILSEHIEGIPGHTWMYKTIQNAVSSGWIERIKQARHFSLYATEEGEQHIKEVRNDLAEILTRSFSVLSAWENDLYQSSIPYETERIPEDLFDGGGLRELHRTLLLHILTYRKEIDLETRKERPMFLFEVMRFMETRYGWRASDAVISGVKREQVESGHIKKHLTVTKVPLVLPQAKDDIPRVLESTVELLTVTPEGRVRLETLLRSTRAILERTRVILNSWQRYLNE